MISNIADTSREALAAISVPKRQSQANDVLLIVTLACKAGASDMSGQEIKKAFKAHFDREIDASTVSARVNGLVAAGRLIRATQSRSCSCFPHPTVRPVFVPVTQARMFY